MSYIPIQRMDTLLWKIMCLPTYPEVQEGVRFMKIRTRYFYMNTSIQNRTGLGKVTRRVQTKKADSEGNYSMRKWDDN